MLPKALYNGGHPITLSDTAIAQQHVPSPGASTAAALGSQKSSGTGSPVSSTASPKHPSSNMISLLRTGTGSLHWTGRGGGGRRGFGWDIGPPRPARGPATCPSIGGTGGGLSDDKQSLSTVSVRAAGVSPNIGGGACGVVYPRLCAVALPNFLGEALVSDGAERVHRIASATVKSPTERLPPKLRAILGERSDASDTQSSRINVRKRRVLLATSSFRKCSSGFTK
mmetsp:Transcript_92560/g.267260  ORF Transcript_92560/g.267260 Transcript_92560/m.267260 type:complete len:226 (+) Transcript_92560:32-709(+)